MHRVDFSVRWKRSGKGAKVHKRMSDYIGHFMDVHTNMQMDDVLVMKSQGGKW